MHGKLTTVPNLVIGQVDCPQQGGIRVQCWLDLPGLEAVDFLEHQISRAQEFQGSLGLTVVAFAAQQDQVAGAAFIVELELAKSAATSV